MKICAFCFPKPGSSITRASSSLPVVASVHSRSVRPSYFSSTSCARVWSLAVMEPGNRWIAGGVEHNRASSSGSAAAIAAGSIEPNRSSTLCGPRNACSMGYCWSSIIPTSRANGESVRTLSAAGSPVMWMLMLRGRLSPP